MESRAEAAEDSVFPRFSPKRHGEVWEKSSNMGVSKNSGTPKWMVYNGNPIMDDLGVPLFSETAI